LSRMNAQDASQPDGGWILDMGVTACHCMSRSMVPY
jgi:hypothetical protein